jgi:aldehyde:ferredoxin oxidoreductase
MISGYMGNVPWIDLSTGKIELLTLDDQTTRDFIGGYGIGARLIYEKQKGGVDPLGSENIFGFYAGPLTGTRAIVGSRFTVMGKSPLTGTWGDANCGGSFGPKMKFAGVDGFFVVGKSDRPVYLLIEDGRCSIKDASQLWGRDTTETEDALKAVHGSNVGVACIGPAGEALSLIAAVMHDKARAAARCGVGTIMGSKKLKAVVVKGNAKVRVAHEEMLKEVNKRHRAGLKDFPATKLLSRFGTTHETEECIISGDAPLKNWSGGYPEDFSNAKALSGESLTRYEIKKYGCWGCPVACGGYSEVPDGPYAVVGHRPEYETCISLGALCLNDNLESVIKANDICNRLGLDTISAGATIAFAIECYEKGLISVADTDGLELTWGNHSSIVELLERMGRREGFGDVLADGSRIASERIGKGSSEFAMHIQGQEVAMHDAKLIPGMAITYQYNDAPGRHTLGCEDWKRPGMPTEELKWNEYSGRAKDHQRYAAYRYVTDCAGLCYFSMYFYKAPEMVDYIRAVTGWEYGMEETALDGERIMTMRHLFNIREGQNPRCWVSPGRTVGQPPLENGALKGVTLDLELMAKEYYDLLGWDFESSIPSRGVLKKLGLARVHDAWGEGRNADIVSNTK